MSLKAFHILFILLSILMTAGCALWSFANGVAWGFGVGSLATSLLLIVYGVRFLKKAKKIHV